MNENKSDSIAHWLRDRAYCDVSDAHGISKSPELQILRLTTPKLKCVWGPVRSG